MKSRLTALRWVGLFALISSGAMASPIRIVTYNILADTGDPTKNADFFTVIQGIGDENVNGIARPIDVLSMQETTSNTTTVDPIVTTLNSMYGAGTYARSPYQATQNGQPTSGNGPNAMVYNTTSLQLISSVGIGTPSSSGPPRQPVRYQFRPVGGTSANDFYLYNSHYKAGTTSSDRNRRNVEAQMIRADAATLPAGVRIIYTGDFNWGGTSEPSYVTLVAAGQGQAFDPINRPGTWELNPAMVDIMTMSATNLRYRDDCHLVTDNVMNDSSGLRYISGSYHTFAVNGSTPLNGNVNSPSNTALQGLPNRAAVLAALTTATDHLPTIADYETNLNPAQPPAITAQPADQTACGSGTASFAVTATGNPAPTYQWRKGATNLVNGGNISGATTATLTINPVGTGDAAADYNCVASNSSGSATSNNASLTVNTGPAINSQPGSQTVCSGGLATFAVVADGAPAPAYQWRKGAANLTNGGNIAGATTATLSINPAGTGDAAADYNCVVTNACGSAASDNAALIVGAAPTITGQPQAQSLVVGDSATFTVVASGSPPPAYQWRKGAIELCDGGNISGAATAALTIDPVGIGDAGVYDVVVTSDCGSAASVSVPFWPSGDMNCNGLVNGNDIAGFVLALVAPEAYAAAYPSCSVAFADMNGDSQRDATDVQIFVDRLLGQ